MDNYKNYHSEEVNAVSSDRLFGLVFCGVFCIVALFPQFKGAAIRIWALWVSSGFFVVALIHPKLLNPLKNGWLHLGALLHRVTNPLILFFTYFGVIAPTGILLKLRGKDLLKVSVKTTSSSYWSDKIPTNSMTDSMRNQY